LAVIQALENRVFDPEVCEYFVGLLDTETSIYAYFQLVQILREQAQIGERRGYDKSDREKIKQWWRENKQRREKEYRAHMEQMRIQKEQDDILAAKQQRYSDDQKQIESALKEKGFEGCFLYRSRLENPRSNFTTHTIIVQGVKPPFEVTNSAEILLEKIRQASSVEELNPKFHRESPPEQDDNAEN
jgi:hypothetical protein